MATFAKPASVPRWGDDLTNVLEPPEAKKDAGWLFQEIPPSNFENWKEQLNGQWWKWINERLADGPTADVFAVLDPSGANADPVVELDGITALRSNFIFRNGVTNSTLRVTKDTQILQWLAGAVQAIAADPTKFVVGPSDIDGMRIFGAGALKALTFDTNENQLRYDVNTDTFTFICNSVSSFIVDDTSILALTPFSAIAGANVSGAGFSVGGGIPAGVGQATFSNQINVGNTAVPNANFSFFSDGLKVGTTDDNPSVGGFMAQEVRCQTGTFGLARTVSEEEFQLQFEGVANMIEYDTVDAEIRAFLGGALSATIDAEGVTAQVFSPTRTGGRLKDRFDVAQRNQVCLTVKVDAIGVVSGRPWNLDTVNNLSVGDWEIFADEQCTDGTLPVVSTNSISGLYISQGVYSDVQNKFLVKTFFRSNGSDVDIGFNLIALGG